MYINGALKEGYCMPLLQCIASRVKIRVLWKFFLESRFLLKIFVREKCRWNSLTSSDTIRASVGLEEGKGSFLTFFLKIEVRLLKATAMTRRFTTCKPYFSGRNSTTKTNLRSRATFDVPAMFSSWNWSHFTSDFKLLETEGVVTLGS
jgi:hypothetical protein